MTEEARWRAKMKFQIDDMVERSKRRK